MEMLRRFKIQPIFSLLFDLLINHDNGDKPDSQETGSFYYDP